MSRSYFASPKTTPQRHSRLRYLSVAVILALCFAYAASQTWQLLLELNGADADKPGVAVRGFGNSTAASEDYLCIGAVDTGREGAAYLYGRLSDWSGVRLDLDTTGAGSLQRAGASVAVADVTQGDLGGDAKGIDAVVAVGAPDSDLGLGRVYVGECGRVSYGNGLGLYEPGFQCKTIRIPISGFSGQKAGSSVAVAGGILVVGAPFALKSMMVSGVVYSFVRRSTTGVWVSSNQADFSQRRDLDEFGAAVAIALTGSAQPSPYAYAVVGAPGRVSNNGRLYVYKVGVDYSSAVATFTLMMELPGNVNPGPPSFIRLGSFVSIQTKMAGKEDSLVIRGASIHTIPSPLLFTYIHRYSDPDSQGWTVTSEGNLLYAQSPTSSLRLRHDTAYNANVGRVLVDYNSALVSSSVKPTSSSTKLSSQSSVATNAASETESPSFSPSFSNKQNCNERDPAYVYVPCYIHSTLRPLVTSKVYKNATDDITRLSVLLNDEIGSPYDSVGAPSRLSSRVEMNGFLSTITYNRTKPVPIQQPSVGDLSGSCRALYFDVGGFRIDELSIACQTIHQLALYGSVDGIDDITAQNILASVDIVYQEISKLSSATACNIKEIQYLTSVGILKTTQGQPVFIRTESTNIYAESGNPKNISKSIPIQKGVVTDIKNSTFLQKLDKDIINLYVISSYVNSHPENLARTNQGKVASQVVSVDLFDADGTIIKVDTNETIVEIRFSGNEDYFPKDEYEDPARDFIYRGDFQKKKCVFERPVCSFWEQGSSLWSTEGMTYIAPTNNDASEPYVICASDHLTDFCIFLEPTTPIPGCNRSWVHDNFYPFLSYTIIYLALMAYVILHLRIIIETLRTNSIKRHLSPLLLHSGALVLVIFRLVYFFAALSDRLKDFSEMSLIIIVSLPFYAHFMIYSLMAFIWMDALKSKSTKMGFLRKTRKYFYATLLLVGANLVIIWILSASAASQSGIIAIYGCVTLSLIGCAVAFMLFFYGRKLTNLLQVVGLNRAKLIKKISRLQASCMAFYIIYSATIIFNSFNSQMLYDHFSIAYSIYIALELASILTILYSMRVHPTSSKALIQNQLGDATSDETDKEPPA